MTPRASSILQGLALAAALVGAVEAASARPDVPETPASPASPPAAELGAPPPGAPRPPLEIARDRVYRSGPLLVVDAVVASTAPRPLVAVQVSVEFLDFFGDLLSVEDAPVRPGTLDPGHEGALRVVTPFDARLRRLRYRFSWQEDGAARQVAVERDVWALGTGTRPAGRVR